MQQKSANLKPDGSERRAIECRVLPTNAGCSVKEVLADIAVGGAHGKPLIIAVLGYNLAQHTVGQDKGPAMSADEVLFQTSMAVHHT